MPQRYPARINRLLEVLRTGERILILTHNNPDPDAIAASMGLAALAESRAGRPAVIATSGIIGRAENRAMVRLLNVNLVPVSEVNWGQFPVVALVDTQPGTGNNALPENITPSIVLDHHPSHRHLPKVPFRMMATRYGATSSLVTRLLLEARVEIEPKLATALVYGIKTDTQDFSRLSSREDEDLFLRLWPKADRKLIGAFETAHVPRKYFEEILRSIRQAFVRGKLVYSDIGEVDQPDMVAEMADFFVRLEGSRWSICTGLFNRALYLSVRTLDPGKQANWVASRIVAGLGSGGGHGQMAGGRIDLSGMKEREWVATEVKRRAIDVLKVRRRREVPLVRR